MVRVLRRYTWTVVPSELLARQRKGQGPCTLALRAQRELSEPVIIVTVIEKRREEKRRERLCKSTDDDTCRELAANGLEWRRMAGCVDGADDFDGGTWGALTWKSSVSQPWRMHAQE